MKRLFALLIVIIMLLSLCACGDDRFFTDEKTSDTSVFEKSTETTSASATSIKTITEITDAEEITEDLTEKEDLTAIATTSAPSTGESTTAGTTTVTATRGGDNANSSFFDDVVFVGDSVTVGLKNYTNYMRKQGKECLGNAKFVCNTSLGYTNSLWAIDAKNNVHPYVNGVKYRVPDGVKAVGGARKALIMFGMNDFMIYGIHLLNEKILL